MPAKKNDADGEYSSAISRFLPKDNRASGKTEESDNERKQDREIALNHDRQKDEKHESDDGPADDDRQSGDAATSEKDEGRSKVRLTAPYVDEAVAHVFEEVWLRIRRMTGEKVSQSEVIEAALAIASDDFDRRERDSDLFRAIQSIRQSE